MNQQAAQNYLRTRVLTATPEQLQMMLFDGVVRFGEQARIALERKDYEQTHNLIVRMQKILTELNGNLKHDLSPDLCGKLAALYNFAYRKLIEANIQHKMSSLDEALDVLKFQRETWSMLLAQLSRQKAATAAARLDNIPAPSAQMERLSMCG
jgi:flagellar protein FliS